MSNKRYEWWKGTSEIIDNKTKKFITLDCPNLLNKKDQRIAELEEQLKKSLKSNNDLLNQIMELQSQLISERLKGENK